MDEFLRSGGVVKKKTSSGCLIIKKKGDVLGGGGGGFSHMNKKRSRKFLSGFEQGEDSLELGGRNYNGKFLDDGAVYRRRVVEDQEYKRIGEDYESDHKRSRMIQYDDFDGKNVNDYMEIVQNRGRSKEFGGGSSRRMMVEKIKHSNFDNSVRCRNELVDFGGKRRCDMDEEQSSKNEARLPVSFSRLKSQEKTAQLIRLQGKNGVLKVKVNKNRMMDFFSGNKSDCQVVQNRNAFNSEDLVKEETPVRTPLQDYARADKRGAVVDSGKRKLKLDTPMLGKLKKSGNYKSDRSALELGPLPLDKSNIVGDDESNKIDISLKLAPPDMASSFFKKREEKRSSPAEYVSSIKATEENFTPQADAKIQTESKKAKVKNGGSTEKQLLREKIREMLLKSGWTIDYRPRKNRDYLDAVYINPNGTAYWSIIKAYEAFQKQTGSESQPDSRSFAPLSDGLISKLTRQTRKKIEKEMKKKRELDSSIKNSDKASKSFSECSDDDQQEERLGKAKNVIAHGGDGGNGGQINHDFNVEKPDLDRNQRPWTANSGVVQARKSRKIGRCTMLVRTSGQHSESDGYVPYTGKRTLLAWLIDSGIVRLSERVQIMNRQRTRVKLEGWITREGIHCGCCSKILTISKFELHAGSKLHQPFQHIVSESGSSLLQCLIDAWNKQEESARHDLHIVGVDGDDPDDDTCGICGDGGDLICCDGCPSTFHLNCLGLQILPPGDWHCSNCICKFCGMAGENVKEKNTDTSSQLALCNLCQKKYHKECSKRFSVPLDTSNTPPIFCGKKCEEIHDHLQKILWVKHELGLGFSWSLIQRTNLDRDTDDPEYPQRVEGNAKIAVALSAMDECFVPIMDRRSGINLLHNVLYNCGSNYSRLNFRGFYTMVLERGDEIISAASIRFHGAQIAEMPYIGTRYMYRRQGMCRRLLSTIESVLCSLKIEKLIIPAIAEHMDTWTVVFGFKQPEESHRKEMKMLSLLVFPRTDWLQKPLLKKDNPEGDFIPQFTSEGLKCSESNDKSTLSPVSLENSDMDPSRKDTADKPDDINSDRTSKVIYEPDPILPVPAAAAAAAAMAPPVLSNYTRVLHALNCPEEVATTADVTSYQCKENKCADDAQIILELAVPSLEANSASCHQMKR